MNLEQIRKDNSFEKAREICMTKKMMMPDQTALNKSCKILSLPDKCNEQNKRKEDTIIRHFSMRIKWFPFPRLQNYKPWNVEEVHKILKCHAFDDDLNEYLEWKKDAEKVF